MALLVACFFSVSAALAESTPIVVFVTVPPQASVVRDVGGPHVVVHSLVAPGQDPHLYEPTPKQTRLLGKAQVFFTIGLPLEKAVLRKIHGHLPNMKVVDSARGLAKRSGCDCGHDHGESSHTHHAHHDHGGKSDGDPHVWLSPDGLQAIAKNAAETLAKIDPEHKNDFEKRLKKVRQSIDKADSRIRAKLAPYRGRSVYVFHPAFGYFCDAYGLKQKAVEVDGRSPSARQLRELVHQAKKDGTHAIFVQKQFDRKGAKVVADALGARLIAIDPLAEDAVENLERIGQAITSGLEKK